MDQTSWFFQMVYCRRSRTYSSCICITQLGFQSNLKPEDNRITIAPHIEVAVMIAMASRTIYGSDPTRNWYWPDNYGLARAWYVLKLSYSTVSWWRYTAAEFSSCYMVRVGHDTMRLQGYKKALPSEQSLDPFSVVVRCYPKSLRVCTRSNISSYQYAIKFSGCISCLITTVEHHEVLALHRSTPLALDVGSTSQRLGRDRYDSRWSAPCIPRSSSP